jgi:galactose mutarotase-like enzyme
MFNISLKEEQYLTYILSDEKAHSRIEVVPERGGIISKWKIQGQDILYLDEERFANPKLSIRGGIPILFPICGNLPDNLFIYHNRQYTIKQHGFARDSQWKVVAQSINNSAKIILSLKSNEQTRVAYPFDFKLIFSYELKGHKLIINQAYTNESKEKMPFSAGFHPYFWCLDKSKLELNIPSNEYQDQVSNQLHTFNNFLDYDQDEIDIAFKSLGRNTASWRDHQRGLKVIIEYSDLFTTLVFWTVKGKNYICLEPWSAPRNALNSLEQLDYLEPGEMKEAKIELSVSYF